MKAVATNKIRKYYKQGYIIPWTQPVCTSNNSHGTFTGGGYFSEGSGDRAYYHVSDNSWPTSQIGGGWDGTCWGTTHSAYGWFNWALPKTIRITGIKVMARNYSQSSTDYVVSDARFYTDSSKTTPIGDTFNLSSCGQQLVISNIPEDGIITDNLYFVKNGGGEYSGFAEIWITVYEWGVVESTESDYDFYKYFYEYSLPTKTERKYYKYGEEVLNATVVGTPTITNYVASNFSRSNYLKLPKGFTPGNDTWEIVFKFTTSSTGVDHSIFGNYGNTYQNSPEISINVNNKFIISIPKDGSSSKIVDNVGGSHTVQSNTAYWGKIEFNGTQYKLSYSLDGSNFTQDVSVTNSTVIYQAPEGFTIGGNWWDSSTDKSFKGSIDLNECYIKVNGQIWWKGTERPIIEGTPSDYDFYKDVNIYKALKSYEKGQYYGN